ncbi:MAG: ATP-dependent Clp protease ATP-binding subunit [Micromonosporaceae bacterium]|nr:ATP-dependent Clp protease ATP-binding subunit [Micromonosporaceae bacterium]
MPPLDVNLQQLIEQLDTDIATGDALAKVSEARLRARTLAGIGDSLIDHYVTAARATGASWSQIGEALGVSKQAAQQRLAGGGRFERFTARARHVVVVAQERARVLKHDTVQPEHVLLGLLLEAEGIAAKVIGALAGSAKNATATVTSALTPGESNPPASGHLPFGDATKRVMEETLGAALELGHNYIGTEHLLLGLLRAGDNRAAELLGGMDITLDRARDAVVAILIGYQHKTG